MIKTEVLKAIKEAEAQRKSKIDTAMAESEQIIANAKLEADNLIKNATLKAEKFKKELLSDARKAAMTKHTKIVEEGKKSAKTTISKGTKQIPQAVSLFVERFKEKLHVST